jgi:hypothetical protein
MYEHSPWGCCEVFMDDGKVHAEFGMGFFFTQSSTEQMYGLVLTGTIRAEKGIS